MSCPDCGAKKATWRSNLTGNIARCSKCDDIAREATGIKREGYGGVLKCRTNFEPYWLESGPLSRVEDDPNFDKKKRQIYIKNKRHEKDVMIKMDSHFGETGEKVQGFELGKDKPAEDTNFAIRR